MNGQEEIKILSYNVQQTPIRSVRELAEGLVDNLINNPEHRYDVVCLQEVFWDPHRKIIAKGLKNGGYIHQVKKSGAEIWDLFPFFGWLRQDSGLFFASRHPHIKRRKNFEVFEAPGEEFDFVAQKGIFFTEVDINGKKLFVFNTHLQSGNHSSLRKLQLDQVKSCIPRKMCDMIDLGGLPLNDAGDEYNADFSILLMGDFNIDENQRSEEYAYLTGEVFDNGRDLFRHQNPGDPGHTHEGDPDRRLDYIFDFHTLAIPEDKGLDNGITKINIKEADVVKVEVVKMKTGGRDVSDHFGVGLTIRI